MKYLVLKNKKKLDNVRLVYVREDCYLLSECSCPYWLKNLVCKHVLLFCNAKKLCQIPILDIAIESNNKRGRKKGISTALTRSDYFKFNEQLFPRGGLAIPVITETTILEFI